MKRGTNPNSLANLKKAVPIVEACRRAGVHVGRKKGSRPWYSVLRDEFKTGKISQKKLMKLLIEKAAGGDMRAIELIMERMDGKAVQPMDVNSSGKTFLEMIQEGMRKPVRDETVE